MTTPDGDALWHAVVATRDEIGADDRLAASLDDAFLRAVLAAEAAHPDNREAASTALGVALDALLERLGPATDEDEDGDPDDEDDDDDADGGALAPAEDQG